MQDFSPQEVKKLTVPQAGSQKGENGRLLFIGGSTLFHAASLWALTIASRIVDMVFYASVPENNDLVTKAKEEFRNGIVVRREDLERYVEEADCILIGPGMMRTEHHSLNDQKTNSLEEINKITDEGEQSYYLTKYLLHKYPEKKWVIDAGALQMLNPSWLKELSGRVICTPNQKEFVRVFGKEPIPEEVVAVAKAYGCIVLLKGEEDIICSPEKKVRVLGGNAGLIKGGTGDVLAGLVGALACTNDLFLAAEAASYFNKKAGERLSETMGLYYNASDLALEIPKVMKEEILEK